MTREAAITKRDAGEPVAVFEGRAWLRHAPLAMLASGVATIVLGIVFADYVPWPTALGAAGDWLGIVLCAIVGSAVAITLWTRARTGHAELFTDRLVIRGRRELATVFLKELDAFDDRSSELVRVEGRSRSLPAGLLFVPTRSEADRATLLEALTAAGVPRDDGQRATPRADRAPLVPLAEAHVGPALGSRGLTWVVGGMLTILILLVLGPCVVTPTAVLIVLGAVFWAGRRKRTIRFHEDRIVLDADVDCSPASSTIAWGDVLAWGGSASELRLILRPGVVREAYGQPRVPTPTSELRATLEALLAERGVRRL